MADHLVGSLLLLAYGHLGGELGEQVATRPGLLLGAQELPAHGATRHHVLRQRVHRT
nr:hypothetical protein [Cellulosimicrobium funkei]